MSTSDGIDIREDPSVFGGRPTIGAHRVTIHDVVALVKQGESVDEIASDFDLTSLDVESALAYYRSHKAHIDRELDEDRRIVAVLADRDDSAAATRLRSAWNGRRKRHG